MLNALDLPCVAFNCKHLFCFLADSEHSQSMVDPHDVTRDISNLFIISQKQHSNGELGGCVWKPQSFDTKLKWTFAVRLLRLIKHNCLCLTDALLFLLLVQKEVHFVSVAFIFLLYFCASFKRRYERFRVRATTGLFLNVVKRRVFTEPRFLE